MKSSMARARVRTGQSSRTVLVGSDGGVYIGTGLLAVAVVILDRMWITRPALIEVQS